MKKGILIGNGLDFYKDLPWLVSRGFSAVYISGDIETKIKKYRYAKECGIKTIILDIAGNDWIMSINAIDAEYYYVDEPYSALNMPMEDLKDRLHYITAMRPDAKFVIGDIRVIQDPNYVPFYDLYHTYTAYTDNWLLPFIKKAIPFGFGNQSPAINRVHKQVHGKMPWIWVYGQNKLLCHPDEYHKLAKTCTELDIPLMMLYLGDGETGKYEFNKVSEEDMLNNISCFLKDEKPYTCLQWWRRFFHRWKLSLARLFVTWDFKEFINKLF